MAKRKKILSRGQYRQLGFCEDTTEKFSLLEHWLGTEEISKEVYNSQINRIVNRVMKKAKPSVDLEDVRYYSCHLTVEGKMQKFLDTLRRRLNSYLRERNTFAVKLSLNELQIFKLYLYSSPYLKSKINKLLIVGLRYPDVELNKICEEYIRSEKLIQSINHADAAFWLSLWEDTNLVPLNAVRLMIVETAEGYKLNPCFNQFLISELLPLIEFQRDKEVLRLEWAKSLKDTQKREAETARKQKRLDAFNCLLELAKKN